MEDAYNSMKKHDISFYHGLETGNMTRPCGLGDDKALWSLNGPNDEFGPGMAAKTAKVTSSMKPSPRSLPIPSKALATAMDLMAID